MDSLLAPSPCQCPSPPLPPSGPLPPHYHTHIQCMHTYTCTVTGVRWLTSSQTPRVFAPHVAARPWWDPAAFAACSSLEAAWASGARPLELRNFAAAALKCSPSCSSPPPPLSLVAFPCRGRRDHIRSRSRRGTAGRRESQGQPRLGDLCANHIHWCAQRLQRSPLASPRLRTACHAPSNDPHACRRVLSSAHPPLPCARSGGASALHPFCLASPPPPPTGPPLPTAPQPRPPPPYPV